MSKIHQNRFALDRKIIAHIDYTIILITLPIVLFSARLIYEIDPSLLVRQVAYIGVTLALSAVVFLLPIRRLFWLVPFYYWLAIALLVAVEFVGTSKFGAQRWITLPLLGLSLQPSEIMKSALILMLCYNITANPPPPEGYGLRGFLKHSFYILLPALLVKIQPDLGTAVLIFALGYAVLFIVGVHRHIIWAIGGVLLVALPLIYNNLHDYQLKRIEQYLSDSPQYQVKQALIAVGNGGLAGNALEEATQGQFHFLPVPESDFIFPYFVERFGLLGAVAMLAAYGLLIWHLLESSWKYRRDRILQVLCAAIGAMIFIHFAINVLMTIKLLPVVGIPLPLFSYGGSSFITFGLLFALMQNLLAFRFMQGYNPHFYRG